MLFLRFIVCVMLATAVGCASPYGVAQIENPELPGPVANFRGIADYVGEGDTRILWVHGMCIHKDSWAVDRYSVLKKALDAERSPEMLAVSRKPDRMEKVIRYEADVGEHKLYTNFLLWSPLTDRYKKRLKFDDHESDKGKFPYDRAKLNQKLKHTLINRCFVDAVVYAGPNGDPIREWMKEQVCSGLGGTTNGGRCTIPGNAPAPRTVLVAESLGSKMLFDAMSAIWDENRSAGVRARASISKQFASVQSVFLLANQIPLLDAADVEDDAGRSPMEDATLSVVLDDIVDARRQTIKGFADLPPVHVVAFTDPNDLLSYRLTKEALRLKEVQVVNVIVSNAPTYLGLFEMPDLAHCGYKWNQYVVGTLVHGYEGKGVVSIELPLDKDCGLAS